jgi:sugar lactone lactonase YvrE
MTVQDNGDHVIAFVSNVFAGTVVRLDLSVGSNSVTLAKKTVIASGYQNRPDSVAFVVGPTGLVYRADEDELFVASTEDNAVYMIQQAAKATKSGGKGKVIYRDNAHLHGPLGMAEAPNGNLLVANSDVINGDPNQPSEIVEFTTEGEFVKQLSVDPAQGGSFGLAVRVKDKTAIFAAVNDNTASLDIWTLPISEE